MGLRRIIRHADLHVHEQQPVDGGFAYERLVLERELYLGLEWKRDGRGLSPRGRTTRQTASPGYTYTYDNAGEMTSETQTSTGDVPPGYDFRGRMVTAVEKTSGGTTLESVTYTYDALDNRIGTDENGTQTWTLYDRQCADHGLQPAPAR